MIIHFEEGKKKEKEADDKFNSRLNVIKIGNHANRCCREYKIKKNSQR